LRFEILTNAGQGFAAAAGADPLASAVLGGRWALTRARNRAGRFTYTLAQS
jgi:hypothetical protein